MHLPELGSYPLTLRDYEVNNPRPGELLLDYTNFELYYINRNTGERVSMAQDIYQRILNARMQNTNIVRYDNTEHPTPVVEGNLSLQNATVSGTKVVLQETKYTYAEYREEPQRYTLILDETMYIYPPIEEREYNTFYYIINYINTVEIEEESDEPI